MSTKKKKKAKKLVRNVAKDDPRDARLAALGILAKNSAGRPMGAPTIYSDKVAKKICLAVALNAKGIRRICDENPELPRPATIYQWLMEKPDFAEQYARAKEDQCRILAEEIVDIADTPKLGQVTTLVGGKGTKKARVQETRVSDMIRHRQLQIDARKWLLSKLVPRIYGDRLEISPLSDPVKELVQGFAEQAKIHEERLREKNGDLDKPKDDESND